MHVATNASPAVSAAVLRSRIDAIIGMIPDEFTRKEDVVAALGAHKESIPYTAPEAIGLRWADVSDTLKLYLPDPKGGGWPAEVERCYAKPF